MSEPVLGFNDALALVLEHAAAIHPPEMEVVDLPSSRGRVLAEAILADRDQPPFDRSTRDGFAVRAAELNSSPLRVVGTLGAGEPWWGDSLALGEALEIMTGAGVPVGLDAVVMVEHVEQAGGSIRLLEGRALRVGENILPRGSEARAGQIVLPAGTTMAAAEIALAAACGQAHLQVFVRPQVAIVATGDELVEIHESPQPQQIRNSNSYALASLAEAAGGIARCSPIVPDRRDALHQAIDEARASDLLVLSGGVSMGRYDLVEEVLRDLGAEFFFTGVRMQPGRPLVFGRLPATAQFPALYFFGLPGNPVSSQVTFRAFVETMLRALSGAGASRPQFVQATLGADVPAKPELTRLLPARLEGTEVTLIRWQGSGDLAANAQGNCYALLPARPEGFSAGEVIRILLR
ncbi:MAG TPA: gephyrin-like molybdotransferase Glp [Granulicella sp.]